MGYVEIPKINVSLPIYHGTDAEILQIAIGHIPGTSLPVGGKVLIVLYLDIEDYQVPSFSLILIS